MNRFVFEGWQKALALVLVGVFALSAALTGTMAWADFSQLFLIN